MEPILYSALVFWIAGLFGGVVGLLQFCIPVVACAITATAYGNYFFVQSMIYLFITVLLSFFLRIIFLIIRFSEFFVGEY